MTTRKPTRDSITQLFSSFAGQANNLVIPRPYIDFCQGDILSALLLSQILYWSERTSNLDGWFPKSYDDWQAEIGMTEYQIKRAIKGDKRRKNDGFSLSDVGVETDLRQSKFHQGAATIHYRVNGEKLRSAITAHLSDPNNVQNEGKADPNNVQNAIRTMSRTAPQQCSERSTEIISETIDHKTSALSPSGDEQQTAADPDPIPPFQIGQSVVWARESREGYGYVHYIPCTVRKITPQRVTLSCPSRNGGTVTRSVKAEHLFNTEEEARAHVTHLDTLADLTPEQQAIGRCSFRLKPDQGITRRTMTLINMVVSELRARFGHNGELPSARELEAAYGWYRATCNATVPTDGAKVAKMVQDYRDVTGKTRAIPLHIPAGVPTCPRCHGNGFLVGPNKASIPCELCLEAEEQHERKPAI